MANDDGLEKEEKAKRKKKCFFHSRGLTEEQKLEIFIKNKNKFFWNAI